MSRVQFDQLALRVPATVVPFERARDDYAAHQTLIKIIWSGHGGQRHANACTSDGRWDMSDWDYLVEQFKRPEIYRPIYGASDHGHGYHQSVVGDGPRDRRQWYSHHAQRWQSRPIAGLDRGRAKPGYRTIKAGHYSLLPPHGQMHYCRGLDPQTGRLAKTDSPHFDRGTYSYPGRQIGWLFSADPANGSKVGHCSPEDMYGRRAPWLGGAAAVSAAMHHTKHAATGGPHLMTLDKLQALQAPRPADDKPLLHSDCRFKPTLESATAIVVPGVANEGTLGLFNAIQKKLYVLKELKINVSIIDKGPMDAALRQVELAEQWRALLKASHDYPELLANTLTNVMQIDITVLPALMELVVGTPQEKQKQALEFVLSQYGLHAEVNYALDDPALMKDMLRYSDNRDAMYALLQSGASFTDPEVLTHLMAHWRDYRQVLDTPTCDAITQYIIRERLTDDLILSTDTDFIKQLHGVVDLPEWPDVLRDAVNFERAGDSLSLLQLLSDQANRATGVPASVIGFSDAARQQVIVQAFAMAVTTLNADWQQSLLVAKQSRDGGEVDAAFLALTREALSYVRQLRMNATTQLLFLTELQSLFTQKATPAQDLQFILYMPAIYRRLHTDLRNSIMDSLFVGEFGSQPVDRLTAEQRESLLLSLLPGGDPEYVTRVLLHPDFPLLVANDETRKRVTNFLLSDKFIHLAQPVRAHLLAHFSQAFELYAPTENKYVFMAFCQRVVDCNVTALDLFPWGRLAMQDEQVFAVARALDGPTMQQYHLVIAHFQRKVSELNHFLHPRQTKAIAPLAELRDVLQSLPRRSIFAGQYPMSLPTEQYKQLVIAIRRCRECHLSDALDAVLNRLVRILKTTTQENAVIQHGSEESAMVAQLPTEAFDVSMVDRHQHIAWRRRGHEYFQAAYATTDGHPEQTTVKVYSSDEVTSGALLMGLDRASGYRMNDRQRAYTKKRVICSSAQLYQDDATILPISVVTVAAPNLRKSAGGQGLFALLSAYDSPYDGADFVKDDALNEPAYFRAMLSAWALSFHALNQQAMANGKRSIVVAPLLGGGAFLAGQPAEVRQAAIKQNILAMITAYNAQPQPQLPELHLCLPKMNAGDRDSAFAYIQSILPELPKLNGRLVISQSDLFDLTYRTYASPDFDSELMDIALVNPASDHVPGGGCYSERRADFLGRSGYAAYNGVDRNHPGEFNPGPRALEEQLAHVTTLMYSQCASMNPDHLRFSSVAAVTVNDDGSTVQVDGDTLARQSKAKGIDKDYSIAEYLASKLPTLYPFASVTLPQQQEPEPSPPHLGARPPAVSRPTPPPPPPRAPSVTSCRAAAVPPVPVSRHHSEHAAILPKQYHAEFLRLVMLLSDTQPWITRKLRGDKFKQVSAKLEAESRGVPYSAVSRYLALVLLTAVSSRDKKLEVGHTDSGEAAVKALNTSFSVFANVVRDQIGICNEKQPLTYGDIQHYAMSTETFGQYSRRR
ncbi:MAG: hypothetical protein P1U34_06085 [Coxiellaceae bacterium]|nr:hypothetical protein [Coxiellaceae bacterium]